jgi:hypothetical protein
MEGHGRDRSALCRPQRQWTSSLGRNVPRSRKRGLRNSPRSMSHSGTMTGLLFGAPCGPAIGCRAGLEPQCVGLLALGRPIPHGFFGKVAGTGPPSRGPPRSVLLQHLVQNPWQPCRMRLAWPTLQHPAPAQPNATTPELRFGDLTRSSSASRLLSQHRQHRQLPGRLHQHRSPSSRCWE